MQSRVLTSIRLRGVIRPKVIIWVVAFAVFGALFGVLAAAVTGEEIHSADRTVLARVAGWDFPFMAGLFARISDLSNNGQRFVMIRQAQMDAGSAAGVAMVVVLNFDEELKRLVPID